MLTEEIRARLEQLNRERLPAATPVKTARAKPSAALSLAELAPGEELRNPSGGHYVVRRPLGELWPRADETIDRALTRFRSLDDESRPGEHVEMAAFRRGFPAATLFLDLETCGFAGSPIFLIGLVRRDAAGLVVDQLLARDYTEERAILDTLATLAAEHEVLVTFNGKSFDWPMVNDRGTRHKLGRRDARDAWPALVHFDLLHHARRRWRDKLPNCKLQTLERYLCRRVRRDDIPGARIPSEYHAFVRGGDARAMRSILEHNALDLVTLVQLAAVIAAGEEAES